MFSTFKNLDPASRAYFFRIFISCLGIFTILGIVLFFAKEFEKGFVVKWVLVSLGSSIVLSVCVYGALHSMGHGVGSLYAGRRGGWKLNEQLAADMDRIRYMKMHKKYADALKAADDLLRQAPDYPEALLLLAQVHWEGYGNAGKARMCLRKIMQTVDDENDPVYRWAKNLYDEILSGGRKPETIWE